MKKNKSNGSRKGRNMKPQYGQGLVRYRNIPFDYGGVTRDINYQIQVYAVYNTATGGAYSLSGTSQVNLYNLLNDVFGSQEFIDLQDDFACFKLDQFFVTFSSTVGPGLTSVQALTPAFMAINYGHSTSVSAANIARSDAAVELKFNNLSGSVQTIHYGLPPTLVGASGYFIGGSMIWFATNNTSASGNLSLMLGYLHVPTFASTASNQFIPVGVLDFHFKVRFAQPILE